jgi:hypothetical protein
VALEGFKVGLSLGEFTDMLNLILINRKTHKAYAKIFAKKFRELDQIKAVK